MPKTNGKKLSVAERMRLAREQKRKNLEARKSRDAIIQLLNIEVDRMGLESNDLRLEASALRQASILLARRWKEV